MMKSTYPILCYAFILVGCGDESSESSAITSDGNGVVLAIGSNGERPGSENAISDNGSATGGSEDTKGLKPVELNPETSFAEQMLNAVNMERAKPQNCGGVPMPPVPSLTWDYNLEAAAFRHSSDMANNNFFSHTGSDNSSASQRIADTGYRFYAMAENIAAGYVDINAVMNVWMNSQGHCENIMSPHITQMGAALVKNADATYRTYWTQAFAAPRNQ